jgi:hypothetical protein
VGNTGATTLDVITATSAGAVTLAGALSGTTGSFSGNMSFNSGYGSAAVAYGCRAWVNFNGTGTVAIRASGNVSSITDNGTGDYTLNFTTALADANYAVIATPGNLAGTTSNTQVTAKYTGTKSTSAVQVMFQQGAAGADLDQNGVAIFR